MSGDTGLEALKVLACEAEVRRAAAKREIADEDGLQSGRMAALKAVREHDPRRGSLDNIAWRWISTRLDREASRRVRQKRLDAIASELSLASGDAISEDAIDLHTAIYHLPEREGKIVRARMAGFTLDDVGAAVGVSRERVRQLELRAHRLLRERLSPARTAEPCTHGPTIGRACPVVT